MGLFHIPHQRFKEKVLCVELYMHDVLVLVKKQFIGSDLEKTSKAIQKALSADAKCCTLCKDEGKLLEDYVFT